MATFTDEDMYRFGVLEVSQRLNAECNGGTDPIPPGELIELLDWLTWRVSDAIWLPSKRTDYMDYDRLVRRLAAAALAQHRRRVRVP